MASTPEEPLNPGTLERAQRGDQEAWVAIVSRLHAPVAFSVRGWLYPQYLEHVEDVTQEIFLKLFRKLSAFDVGRGSQFRTWVLTVAHNHCLDLRRRLKKRVVAIRAPASIPESSPGPLGAVSESETFSQVRNALTGLAVEQREAFEMHYLDGLDYRDISRRTGIAANLVKSRANNARLKLRERLRSLDPRTAA